MLLKLIEPDFIFQALDVPDRAYTLVNSNFEYDGAKLVVKVDDCAEKFLAWSLAITIGGDNDDVTITKPRYLPIATRGSMVIFKDDDLAVAEKELGDYEYILIPAAVNGGKAGYLIWGECNVNRTEAFTPQLEGVDRKAVFFESDDDGSNFKPW